MYKKVNNDNNNRIIYYYQTFCGLSTILIKNTPVTHIHLSSIHFGTTKNKTPYIHLNDNLPDDKIFDSVWYDLKIASQLGIKIVLMIGGTGGAYQALFSDFNTYYPMLKKVINEHPIITGIDLDIEEQVDINNVKMLISKLHMDFGNNFIISMTPIQGALAYDSPGLGGFIYKDLYNSPEGKLITYFNSQFYGNFSYNSYQQVINNGYPQEKIVIGMLSSQFTSNSFINALEEIVKIKNKYPNFAGVYDWEFWNAQPCSIDPSQWSKLIKDAMNLDNKGCSIM
jgi:hypothetical protein